MNQQLASEEVVISAPFSFHGSAVRIWKITRKDNAILKWLVMVPLALMTIFVVWGFIFVWYCIFGVLLVPYRLIRRGSRKRKMENLRHHELLDVLESKKAGRITVANPDALDDTK